MTQQQRSMRFVLSSLFIVLLSGCVGPMVMQETARTVGDGNSELSAAYSSGSQWAAKWNYGLNENWDMGIQIEALSLGLRTKYSLLNGQEGGWSLATAFGAGFSIGGNHYYFDLIASHLKGAWEPYTALRVVHMKIDPVEFKDDHSGETDFTIDLPDYNYGQYFLGTRYWFNKHWLLSLEGSMAFAIGKGIHFEKAVFFSAGAGYKF